MAIAGVNSGVSSNYATYYTSKSKSENVGKSSNKSATQTSSTNTTKNTGSTKDSNVTTSTVEMKTSTSGVTRTDQIKTGYSNVNDYSQYLQSKYSYMNTGTTSMQGVPTTVSVSSAFLKKCMNDPEKAKFLEENLSALPECAAKAVAGCQGTLTNLSYKVDANGNISVAISGTSDPDGKIAKENAERKAKESKEKEKKLEEKRAAKKAEEKKREERLAAKKALTEKVDNNLNTSSGQNKIAETLAYTSQTVNVGSNFNSYS